MSETVQELPTAVAGEVDDGEPSEELEEIDDTLVEEVSIDGMCGVY